MHTKFTCLSNPIGLLLRLMEFGLRAIGIIIISTSIYAGFAQSRIIAGALALGLGIWVFWLSTQTFEPDLVIENDGIKIYLMWRWINLSWKDISIQQNMGNNLVVSEKLPFQYFIYCLKHMPCSKCFGLSMQTHANEAVINIKCHLTTMTKTDC